MVNIPVVSTDMKAIGKMGLFFLRGQDMTIYRLSGTALVVFCMFLIVVYVYALAQMS